MRLSLRRTLRQFFGIGNLDLNASAIADADKYSLGVPPKSPSAPSCLLHNPNGTSTWISPLSQLPLGEPEGLIFSRVDGKTLQFNADLYGNNQAVVQFPNGERVFVDLPANYRKSIAALYSPGYGFGGLVPGNTASGTEDLFVWLLSTMSTSDIAFTNDESGASITAWNPNIGKRCLGVLKLAGGNFRLFEMQSDRVVLCRDAQRIPVAIANGIADYPVEGIPIARIFLKVRIVAGLPSNNRSFGVNLGSTLHPPVAPSSESDENEACDSNLNSGRYQTGANSWDNHGNRTLLGEVEINDGKITLYGVNIGYWTLTNHRSNYKAISYKLT